VPPVAPPAATGVAAATDHIGIDVAERGFAAPGHAGFDPGRRVDKDRTSRPTAELLAVFRRYRDLYSSPRLAAALTWARPYIDLMADLMQEIRPR
jgi:hypothetical protein